MGIDSQAEPAIFVIFGAAGDLSWRKLVPALYSLFRDRWLPEKFLIIGTGHRHVSGKEFRQPEAAETLIAQDGLSWVMPTFLQCQEDAAVCRVTMVQA